MIINFHCDAGHGWFAVKRELINKLGIADKITSFSYQRGKTVYCEEDCDADTLFKALDEAKIEYKVKSLKQAEYNSPIRSYECYRQ